jgi:hypothetical protein
MSVRVRGLVPTFPDGSQVTHIHIHTRETREVYGKGGVTSLVPTLPDGSQAIVEKRNARGRRSTNSSNPSMARILGGVAGSRKGREGGGEGGGARGGQGAGVRQSGGLRAEDHAIMALSEEYIDNLHLQVRKPRDPRPETRNPTPASHPCATGPGV